MLRIPRAGRHLMLRQIKPAIDRLEKRVCLDASVSFSPEGLLHVLGSNGDDVVGVSGDGDEAVVDLNGNHFSFPKSKVNSLLVETGAGIDTIRATLDDPTTLRGGEGRDDVVG